MFYAHLYDSSPVGIDYSSTLQPDVAAFLQGVAAEATWGATCGLESYGTSTSPPNLLTLAGTGDTGPGGTVTLTPGGLLPGNPGTLLFSSFAKAFLPLSSGVLLIDLTKPVLPTRFIANGDSWSLTIPPEPEFTGLDLYFQVLADDSSNPGTTQFSPGVHLQVCP
jgi:hypothetical protein